MGDVVAPPLLSSDHSLLRRRNSIPTSIASVPSKLTFLHLHNSSSSSSTPSTTTATSSLSSFPSDDLDSISFKPPSQSYTSLKDILPSVAVNSPKPNAANQAQPEFDICIRNRLVKQAAWAYLQPMSTSPGSTGGNFFHRIWPRVAAFIDLVQSNVVRALRWTLTFIRNPR